MLSILIPTKDYNCRMLVEELSRQGESLGISYEIILAEDGSSCKNMEMNRPVSELPKCRIIEYKDNQGRARIRNRLAEEAQYPNLIFIDSDAVVEKKDFLLTYLNFLQDNDVVCGGLYHPTLIPSPDCTLRYKYEKNADKKRHASDRSKIPYDNFATFNFAIKRELFLAIRFDEKIKKYGYEDTLFGYKIKAKGIKIKHIDNPLLHTGLENNKQYMEKVEQSLRTLYAIRNDISTTPLLAAYYKLEKISLVSSVAFLWRFVRMFLYSNLIGENPSLFILKLYKLGYYCNIVDKNGK